MIHIPGLKFHHFGLATRKPEKATLLLKSLGYTIGDTVYDPLQNANLIMCTSTTAPEVEIISPGEGENPLDKILNKFQAGIYHLCYETNDLNAALEAMKQAGIRAMCVSPAKGAILFGGDEVSFYQIMDFGLIEIIDRSKKS